MIKDLTEEISFLKREHEQLKSDVENHEQYTRRNCLLVHGIPIEQGKITDSIVLNAINKRLEERLIKVDIEHTHIAEKPKDKIQSKKTKTK